MLLGILNLIHILKTGQLIIILNLSSSYFPEINFNLVDFELLKYNEYINNTFLDKLLKLIQ